MWKDPKTQKDNKQAGDHFHGCDRVSGLTIHMQVARQLYEIVLIYSKSHRKQAGVCICLHIFPVTMFRCPKYGAYCDITFHNMGSCYSSFILKWNKLIFPIQHSLMTKFAWEFQYICFYSKFIRVKNQKYNTHEYSQPLPWHSKLTSGALHFLFPSTT